MGGWEILGLNREAHNRCLAICLWRRQVPFNLSATPTTGYASDCSWSINSPSYWWWGWMGVLSVLLYHPRVIANSHGIGLRPRVRAAPRRETSLCGWTKALKEWGGAGRGVGGILVSS